MLWRAHVDRFVNERVILLAGWLCFLVYAFPGYLSGDSVWQLAQARGLEPLSDWHPPLMALIWRPLDAIVPGPFLMLVLQSATFVIGVYVLLARVMAKRVAAVAAVVLLLLPQNIIVMAVIWKDSQMAGFIALAIPLLLAKKRGWRVTGYVLLFLATAVRYNAAAPIFPIIVVLFDWEKQWPWFKRWPVAAALWVAITVGALFVNGWITTKRDYPWPISVASIDIAGTIRFADDLDADELVRETPDAPWEVKTGLRDHMVQYYRADNWFKRLFEGPGRIFHYPETATERDALKRLWTRLVREHPAAFLRHRKAVFDANLDGRVAVWHRIADSDESAALLHLDMRQRSLQDHWANAMASLMKNRVFRPRLYWLLAVILICFTRRNRLAFAILASGIAHELGLLAVAPAVDYRYNHWMVLATLLGLILVFVERRAMAHR